LRSPVRAASATRVPAAPPPPIHFRPLGRGGCARAAWSRQRLPASPRSVSPARRTASRLDCGLFRAALVKPNRSTRCPGMRSLIRCMLLERILDRIGQLLVLPRLAEELEDRPPVD